MSKKEEKVVKETGNAKQTVILVASIIVIILCIIFSVKIIKNYNARKNKDNEIESDVKNVDVLKDAKVGNLTITNVNISIEDGVTSYKAIVNNDANSDYYIDNLYVIFTIGDQIERIPALSDLTISANENQMIDLILDTDMAEVTKIEYSIE